MIHTADIRECGQSQMTGGAYARSAAVAYSFAVFQRSARTPMTCSITVVARSAGP
ncbi:hypothetical protein [Streptomyces sp. NBC_01304]|uniref:hypothetical protein n=1 Tax=Streptomyces sp. NBC_01304 TaxID=2903818 RepID=UPI002E132044|nr:hypothetical protein OG430_00395 [Streptomyces sp. NBC_01304]